MKVQSDTKDQKVNTNSAQFLSPSVFCVGNYGVTGPPGQPGFPGLPGTLFCSKCKTVIRNLFHFRH